MDDIFSIIRYSRFCSLHIIIYKKALVAIAAIRFGPIASSKVTETFNSKVAIGIDLVISLTFRADSVSNFDCLTLVVAFVYMTSMFLLVPL